MTDTQKAIAREVAARSSIAARIYFTGAVNVTDIGVPGLFVLLSAALAHGDKDAFEYSDKEKTILTVKDFLERDAWETIGSSVLKECHEWFSDVVGLRYLELNTYCIAGEVRDAMRNLLEKPHAMLAPTTVLPTVELQMAYTMFLIGQAQRMRIRPSVFFCFSDVRNAICSGAYRVATLEEKLHVDKLLLEDNSIDIVQYLMRQC